jgi:hypothetical protein
MQDIVLPLWKGASHLVAYVAILSNKDHVQGEKSQVLEIVQCLLTCLHILMQLLHQREDLDWLRFTVDPSPWVLQVILSQELQGEEGCEFSLVISGLNHDNTIMGEVVFNFIVCSESDFDYFLDFL